MFANCRVEPWIAFSSHTQQQENGAVVGQPLFANTTRESHEKQLALVERPNGYGLFWVKERPLLKGKNRPEAQPFSEDFKTFTQQSATIQSLFHFGDVQQALKNFTALREGLLARLFVQFSHPCSQAKSLRTYVIL